MVQVLTPCGAGPECSVLFTVSVFQSFEFRRCITHARMLDPSLLRLIAHSSASVRKRRQLARLSSYLRERHKLCRGNGVDKLIQNWEVEIVFSPGHKFSEICFADAAYGIKIFIKTVLDLKSHSCERTH